VRGWTVACVITGQGKVGRASAREPSIGILALKARAHAAAQEARAAVPRVVQAAPLAVGEEGTVAVGNLTTY